MTIGFVYLLTNEYMDDVYKVGCTERSPHERAEELSKPSGVPAPFKVLCYIEVRDFQKVERDMHEWLKEHRISTNREFFYGALPFAVSLFWYLPSRLSFCEPGRISSNRGHGEGMFEELDCFGDIHSFEGLRNPWAKADQVVIQNGASIGFDEMDMI